MKLAQKGQALVLVLLSLAVVLTLILFILSRSITDIAVSTTEEEAIRAFSAAEAGVEQALIIGTTGSKTIGDANFSAEVTGFSEGSETFNYPINLASGDTATVWFTDHDANGDIGNNVYSGDSIKVCWGKVDTPDNGSTTPAIEVSLFYDQPDVKIGRTTFDPNSVRTINNSFTATLNRSCIIDGVSYQFWSNIDLNGLSEGLTSSLLFARVRMLYNSDESHAVGFDTVGVGILPSQGQNINSLGEAGGANRRIEVFQAWPEPPNIFDYAIFSSSGLIKS